MREIRNLWKQHLDAKFPADWRGEEIDGIDLVLLDSDTAGCVETFLTNHKDLDSKRFAIVGLCHRDLDRVLCKLTGKAHANHARLEELARLILCEVRDRNASS